MTGAIQIKAPKIDQSGPIWFKPRALWSIRSAWWRATSPRSWYILACVVLPTCDLSEVELHISCGSKQRRETCLKHNQAKRRTPSQGSYEPRAIKTPSSLIYPI